jgi:hypothetical protein
MKFKLPIEDIRGETVRLGNKVGKIVSIIYPPNVIWSDELNDYIPNNQPKEMVGVKGFDGEYYEWDAREVETFTADSLLE